MTYRRRLLSVLPPLALGALLLLVAYAQQAQTGGAGGQQSLQQKMAQGQQIYTQAGCVGCHGSQGQGQSGVGPALAGNQHIRNPQAQIAQILHGGGGMPAFGGRLSNQQIAQVATYERNSWGNDFGEIQAQQVAALRGGQPPAGGQTGGGGQQIQIAQAFQRTGEPQHHSQLTAPDQLYAENCASCHGGNGQGGQEIPGPALAGNQGLQDADAVVGILVKGSGKMPAYDYWLSADQIAKIASYIRTQWNNGYGKITTDQVKQIRKQIEPQQRQQSGGAVTGGGATGGTNTGGATTGGQ